MEVTVIGAGPHGLAAAAFLRAAGLGVRVFGDPMSFWREHMPAGMLLRSSKRASNIASPGGALSLDRFGAERGRPVPSPVPLEDFLAYGLWFQERVVPHVDRRLVRSLDRRDTRFRLELDDGAEVSADRVVVAAGIAPFPRRHPALDALPPELVSHTSAHRDLTRFGGRRVAVLGGGQSALETAALLHETGAEVEVLARTEAIWWLAGPGATRRLSVPQAPTDIGGPVSSWLAAAPDVFRRLPSRRQPELAFRCIRPAGAHWLRERLAAVPITTGRTLRRVSAERGEAVLDLDDGSTRRVDHLMLGTGYEVDLRGYGFLSPSLLRAVDVSGGYPVLGPGLETSVPGLHVVGAPAAQSFGPVMRFVTGSWYGAQALAARVAGRRQPPLRFSF
jgi:FAD-dependent urate hydroxylase